MKNAPVRRLIILMLIVVLLAAATPMGGAASGIFVNGSTDTLPAELSACYALGADALPIEVTNDVVSFPWFAGFPQPEEISAYAHFTGKLIGMAKTQKRVTAKEKDTDNEKYAFRCFLLRLGFIGDEYKAARKILLRNLTGSGAFKNGTPKTQEYIEKIEGDAGLYDDVMSLQDKEVAVDELSE